MPLFSLRPLALNLLAFSALAAAGSGPVALPAMPASASRESADDTLATAIFAGGSFWCLEPAFEKLPGVDSAQSGYTGGQGPNPNFESVSAGNSAYVEAVQVFYHPKRIKYAKLLDAFW